MIELFPSIDLSLTGISVACDRYMAEFHMWPVDLVVAHEALALAEELAELSSTPLYVRSVRLPEDDWFVSGPEGVVWNRCP